MSDVPDIGSRIEGLKAFLDNAGMDGDELLKVDTEYDQFMSFENKQNIDYGEVHTELQIRDGINRIKQLALKVIAYTHVKHHEPMPWVFQEKDNHAPTFHLKE